MKHISIPLAKKKHRKLHVKVLYGSDELAIAEYNMTRGTAMSTFWRFIFWPIKTSLLTESSYKKTVI